MVAAMKHESFYRTSSFVDEKLGVYVGSVEPEGSFAEKMPVTNGDVTLMFSGEDFPEPGTAQRLKERDHRVEAKGASYLVHLYEEEADFPAQRNGRFHGLAVDKRSGTATLFNDRYGMHRIYYHEGKDTFYFAAEAKAILAVVPGARQVNTRSLGELVSCGCVLGNRTIFEGIQVLPAGSAWSFQGSASPAKTSYFQPSDWEQQEELDLETYYQKLRETFARVLPRYFNGSQPIGLSLTGGLDTRMITAWMKPSPGSMPCYSFGGMYRDCEDVVVARKVAKAWGQTYQVIPVDGEFLSQFPRYAERAVYLTDGCTAVNRAVDLYANEKVREIAPVRMTGNYGGEVLRRVVAFKPVEPAPELFRPEFAAQIEATRETYGELRKVHPLSFAVFRQAPWHHYGLLALEQTQVNLRSPFLDNEFVRLVFRAPQSALANNDISLRLIADGSAALYRIATDRGYAGTNGPALAAAIQAWIEFTVKAEYAYDYGMPQWVARTDRALAALHLERLFLGRHKFAHYRIWYRDQLANYVREMLLDPKALARPYLNRTAVEEIVSGHLRGVRNYTTEIHTLLTLELVHRQFIDSQ